MKAILSFLLLFLFLLVFFALYINTSSGEKWLGKQISLQITDNLPINVSIEQIKFNLFNKFHIKNVQISLKDTTNPVFECFIPETQLELGTAGLFKKNIHIHNLIVQNPKIQMYCSPQQNIAEIITDRTNPVSDNKASISFHQIRINNGIIIIAENMCQISAEIDSLSFSAKRYSGQTTIGFGFDHCQMNYNKYTMRCSDWDLRGVISDHLLYLNNISGKLFGLDIKGKSQIGLNKNNQTLQGHLDISGVLSETDMVILFPELIDRAPAHTRISASFLLSGTPKSLSISNTGQLSANQGILNPDFNLAWSLQLQENILYLKQFDLNLGNGNITANGQTAFNDIPHFNAKCKIKDLEIGPICEWLFKKQYFPSGSIAGDWSASGRWNDIVTVQLKGTLRSNNLFIKEKKVHNLNLQVSLNQGLFISNFFQGDNYFVSNIHILNKQIEGNIHLKIAQLSDYTGLFNLSDISGKIGINAGLSGSIQKPDMKFTMTGRSLSIDSFPADSLFLAGHINKNIFEITDSYIRGSGELNVQNFLQDISRELDGEFEYSGSINGTPGNLSGLITLAVSSPGYQTIELDSINIGIGLIGDSLYIERGLIMKDSLHISMTGMYNIHHQTGSLHLYNTGISHQKSKVLNLGNVTLGVKKDEDNCFDGHFQLNNIDLSCISILTSDQIQMQGFLSSSAKWHFRETFILDSGSSTLDKGYLQLSKNHEPIHHLNISAHYKSDLLDVDTLHGEIRGIPFALTGNLQFYNQDEISTQGKFYIADQPSILFNTTGNLNDINGSLLLSKFDLSLMESFIPQMEDLGGIANGSFSFSGSVLALDLDGKLNIKAFSFRPGSVPFSVKNGILSLRVSRHTLFLDTLTMDVNEGIFHSSGLLQFTDNKISNVRLDSRVSNIKYFKEGQLNIHLKEANLTCFQNEDQYLLEGDIIFGESRYLENFQTSAILPFFKKVEKPYIYPPSLFFKTRLNVRIRESEYIWIDNNLAHLRIHSELSLRGNLSSPIISGRLSAEEGYLLYLDRKFQIKKGLLDFNDPYKINPTLDIVAIANLKSYQTLNHKPYTITLSLEGSLDEPVTSLQSEPELDKASILTLLTTGATREQITGSHDNSTSVSFSQILQERAALVSSGKISGYVSRRVGSLLGLKEMSIEGNLFRFGNAWGPQLVASRTITSRMEISYSTTVGYANEQKIRLDYRLKPNLFIQGEVDKKSNSGIDLKYQIKFK